jgi:hypothetical protein
VNEKEEENRAPIDIDDVPGCAAPSRLRILVLVRYGAVPESEPNSFAVPPLLLGSVSEVGVGLASCFLRLVLALYYCTL